MATRTRRDVWKLAEWDDTLLWYSRAVREMWDRPIADSTSWRYQAAIHEYVREGDPLATASDKLPKTAEQKRYWNQCQHNSWYFLPWHRWYLLYFEAIVAATVVELGGPADWSLPYWNYSDDSNPDARRLPPAFRAQTLPDGTPNALRVNIVRARGNNGAIVAGPEYSDLTCLTEPSYEADPVGGSPGFGGPKTVFNHSGGAVGFLEAVPHGSMHGAVGGWMGRFGTAGLDPLFWLHHCNIDRLWEVWLKRDPQHVNPTDADWLGMRFDFRDAKGKAVKRKVGDSVDTAAIGYEYEDVLDPLAPGGGLESLSSVEMTMADRPIPEMVGATEGPVALTGKPTTAHVEVSAPSGPALESLEADEAPPRVYVNVENVTGEGDPRAYKVFVNGEYAGLLPMFGVAEATAQTDKHPGGGLHYRLDVTDAVQRLQSEGNWNPADMQVTFVPAEEEAAEGALESLEAAEPEPSFQVGRVSVYFA